jgi:hypothetical protein
MTDTQTRREPDLDARYGRGTGSRRIEKRLLWVLGGVIVAISLVWVVLVAFDGTNASLETNDVAHEVLDEHSVRVSFTVNVAPGTETVCAVQALNEDHAIVGWKIVEIPASEDRNRVFTETVRTSQQSNTGLIYSCWLP